MFSGAHFWQITRIIKISTGATVEQFEQAKTKLSTLKNDPGNEVKLKIYALFKQVGGSSDVPAVTCNVLQCRSTP